ncbi:hypothetical protein EJ05DRAFT_511726 [Pseudovirgaria hyperparasitica]|uniref:F-box domain-containing protein n=1 Tax=Pseudovirgaria hyperparasitica TaxID=470096 RepID=A0A6A6W4K9_9PEZI|nr:uncharacterized protein EJ05DRAFT_511726 [Pseudovirgaria hyperparasitica]KAF2756974.1 hypothetical protein EJ05DRAFT_511726 [Pseudovirgaria hyperparasitica]
MIFLPIFEMTSPAVSSKCHLLELPQELRDEIYNYLLEAEGQTLHCYDGIPRHNDFPRAKIGRTKESHIDRKIHLPIRFCQKPLAICRQLRTEFLDFLDAAHSKSGPIIITMDALRPISTAVGWLTPVKKLLTPAFMRSRPAISASSHIHFRVWPGWNWWHGDQNSTVEDQLVVMLPFITQAKKVTLELCLETWDLANRDIELTDFFERLQPFLGSTLRRQKSEPFGRVTWLINLRTYDQDGIEPSYDMIVNLYEREEVYIAERSEIQVVEKIGKLAPDDWFAATFNGESNGPPFETKIWHKSISLTA